MKTDKDLNATNQLIKVIRGEAYSMPQTGHPEGEETIAVTVSNAHTGWWTWGKIVSLVLILGLISFTFLSVSFLSGEIKNLENIKNELVDLDKQIGIPSESGSLWKKKDYLLTML